MVAYCASVWQFRYFWFALVRMDLRTRYRGSVLGMGWSLLQPIAMTAIFCLIFSQMFNEKISEYAPYVMVGMAFWTYFHHVVVQGCQSFFQGEQYIRQFPAPMAIYPLRTVLAGTFHFSLAVSLALFLVATTTGVFNVLALLTLIPTLALLLLLVWSVALLAGVATVFFRDTRHLCEIGLQLLFYLTPIMYRKELIQGRRIGLILDWNPLVPFLTLLRDPVGEGKVPPLPVYGHAALVVLLVFAVAAYTLSRLERRIIFDL